MYQFKDDKKHKRRMVRFNLDDVNRQDMEEIENLTSDEISELMCYPTSEVQCRRLLSLGWTRSGDSLVYPVKTIIGNIPRTAIDLNRGVANKTEFADKIRRSIRVGDSLLDIHSYAPNTKTDDWRMYDIVLLTVQGRTCPELLHLISDSLRKAGLKVAIYPAAHYNLVQHIAAKAGGKPVLIEVNEKYLNTPMMDRMGDAIALAVKKYRKIKVMDSKNPDKENIELYHRFQSLPVDKKWNIKLPDWDKLKWTYLGKLTEYRYRCSKWSHAQGLHSKLDKSDMVSKHDRITYYHPIVKSHPYLLRSGSHYLIYGYSKILPEFKVTDYEPWGGIDDADSQLPEPTKGISKIDMPKPHDVAWLGRLLSLSYMDKDTSRINTINFRDTDLVAYNVKGKVWLLPVKAVISDGELIHFRG